MLGKKSAGRFTTQLLASRVVSLVLDVSLLGLTASGFGQGRTGTIEVRVGDEADESPIAKAEVRLYIFGQGGYTYHALADAGGRTDFGGLPAGPYVVDVRHSDYEPAQTRVDVFAGQTTLAAVLMHRKKGSAPVQVNGVVSSASLNVPGDAKKEFERGESQLSSEPSQSIEHFQNAVRIYPKYAEAYVMMALAYMKLNQQKDAGSSVEKAIALDPKLSKAYTVQGRLLLDQQQYQKAETALQESIRLDPEAWDSRFELARCLYNTSRINEALDQAVRAQNLPGANPLTHLLLVDIYMKLDQKKEALAELEAFEKADPTSPLIPRVKKKIEQLRSQP